MRITNSGNLTIGSGTIFNIDSSIVCSKGIRFGANCMISWECLFMDTDFHKIYSVNDVERENRLNPDREIEIGNHVWIGARSTVLKGTRVPDDSIVAAGSVVTKRMNQSNSLYIGNNLYKKEINWKE